MDSQTLLWNINEAAAALRISPWTVRRWIYEEKLPAVRLGRRVLVEPEACRKLIQQNRQEASH